MKKYCLIFDTNVLFRTYDKYGDFTCFSLSNTLDNIIEDIEKRDVYDLVSIRIPGVVWHEMREQNIKSYNEKLDHIKDELEKFKFPFHKLEGKDQEYESFLDTQIKEYKRSLQNGVVKIQDLALPTNACYHKLIKRAFEKRPPFEAKDKKSDKGFKDAILWESILQYKRKNPTENIILYTNDNMFNDELKQEYKDEFNEEIMFVRDSTEEELRAKLSEIALEKDATIPIPEEDRFAKLKKYLYGDNFLHELQKFETEIIGNNEYLHIISAEIIHVDPIEEPIAENEILTEYTIFVTCKLNIEANHDKLFCIEKRITIYLSSIEDNDFLITDIEVVRDDEI